MEKFLSRNNTNIDKLNNYLIKNKDNVVKIMVSTELGVILFNLPDSELPMKWCETHEEYNIRKNSELPDIFKYKGVRVQVDYYQPSNTLYFITKDNKMTFEVPCVGGCYHDEEHK